MIAEPKLGLMLISLTHPLILIIVGGAIASLLHWLISRVRIRALSRIQPAAVPSAEISESANTANVNSEEAIGVWNLHLHSLRQLLIEWGARGLLTLVWLLYFFFLMALLPHARDRFESVRGLLKERLLRLDNWFLDYGVA
ncbi:MAG TPA: hypothetical protein VEF04_18855, partial [Blastocatellia bacterium]|nr:hypothetical protein [Blastocatellia bacterium]